MNWTKKYRDYNASTITFDGVISLEQYEKFVFVSDRHLVVDLLKDCGGLESIHEWYQIDRRLFQLAICELNKWASVIRAQRFFKWCYWKTKKPSLENIKAFQNTYMASTLPREIIHKIVEVYFNPRQRTGSATNPQTRQRA
jgi:hypothetical protein